VRVALGVALPLLVTLVGFSLVHYLRERRVLETQMRSVAMQLGDLMNGALRQAMLANDRNLLEGIVADIAAMQAIERVQIVDDHGTVRLDSAGSVTGGPHLLSSPGCVECHALPTSARERTVHLTTPEGTLRIGAPIDNEAACRGCHPANGAHLGMVLVDVPLQTLQAGIVRDLTIDLAGSAAVALAVSAGVFVLIHRLIVRRLETLRAPLASYASGDFAVRLPSTGPADEIGLLAASFNAMADDLARHARSERRRRKLREQAAIEERDRIARDLHDGLAQILGYVNTKAQAVRLFLSRGQTEAASAQLQQLEDAANEVLADVRQAILGLRLTAQPELDLASKLLRFVEQFRRQSGVAVHFEVPEDTRRLHLAAGAEGELLRIVQEALSNIRKHAAAHEAWLRLEPQPRGLELTIADDGEGFDPAAALGADRFGLVTMHERAAAIGADLQVDSSPGRGTRITVRLATPED
jgi:signal transduction histidine kinase